MSTITTGAHPKALYPGIHAWFGVKYKEYGDLWTKLFEVRKSNRNYEELVQHYGFGLVPVKPENTASVYQGQSQGPTSRGTNVAYSLGYIVTKEEVDDNLYAEVAMSRASSLAFSAHQTRENVAANVYNRAFNSAYVGGDGVELLSTAHPSNAGNQSNELAVAADFSEASLEDLCIQMMNAKNADGLNISLTPKCLIIPTALKFEAQRVLKSLGRVGSADNDINAVNSLNVIPEVVVNPYLTDSDAWFVKANGVTDGLIWFDRKPIEFSKDSDFDTDNFKHKMYMRFVPMWGDWRQLYGSAGA